MVTPSSLSHFDGLDLADPQFMDRSPNDILLDAVVYSQIIEGSVVKGKPNELIAIHSELGWLLSGELRLKGSHNVTDLA